MTPAQQQQFSVEWQKFFTALRERGYTVTYAAGIIHIQNAWNSMKVRHERGRWIIELEKPLGVPDRTSSTDDTTAIGRIERMLLDAKAKPLIYSFAIRVPVAAVSEGYEKGVGKRGRKSRKSRNHRR